MERIILDGHGARRARLRFIREAERRATEVAFASPWHGPDHWRAVARMGLLLLGEAVEADPDVLLAFAALHDTQRESDYTDPQHGARAAAAAARLRAEGMLGWLDDEQFVAVCEACRAHTTSPPTPGTIGACLDADRLTLWRVGKVPHPEFLSHPEALGLSHRGRALTVGTDGPWRDIVAAYVDQHTRRRSAPATAIDHGRN
jgi:uncharacterized protein